MTTYTTFKKRKQCQCCKLWMLIGVLDDFRDFTCRWCYCFCPSTGNNCTKAIYQRK